MNIWSKFTKKYLSVFNTNEFLLNYKNQNNLIKLLKFEKKNIINFINSNINLYITINTNSLSYNKSIKLYANNFWVDTKNVLNQLNKLDYNIYIEWNSVYNNTIKNSIIIKCNKNNLKFLKRIKILILIIEYLKYKLNNTNINLVIFLVLTDLKKKFPNNNTIININNVNSGYSNLSSNIIYIWRYEEFEKVLFHEVLHLLNLNFDIKIHHKFIINGPTSYYESITDFWAIFYNLIYLSILTHNSLDFLFKIEFLFIKNQALILNNYFILNDWKKSNIINQNTPAFSYYILKYLLFKYLIFNKSLLIDNFIYNNTFIYPDLFSEYTIIFNNIIKKKFINYKYINILSSRMTLLELN